jgi:hypothetical protein
MTTPCAVPTGKFRILWDNKFDIPATLDASTEAVGFPVENLQHDWFLKHWRSTDLTAETIDADIISVAYDIKAFFVYSHNIRTTADFHIQADDTAGYGSLTVDDDIPITADMVIYNLIGKFWASAQTWQYWRQLITDDDSGHPDGYIREGRVFLGDYFEPTYRPTTFPETTDIDPSTILASLTGQKQANVITPYRRIRYRWSALPADDVVSLKTIFAVIGKHSPYFICWDSDDPIKTTHYIRNVSDWLYSPIGNDYYSVEIEVETER